MIASVAFLHKLGYVHFDIKPSNYLVQENGQLLLSDFCLTIKEKDIANYSTEEFEGDSMYISPELFYKDKDVIPICMLQDKPLSYPYLFPKLYFCVFIL